MKSNVRAKAAVKNFSLNILREELMRGLSFRAVVGNEVSSLVLSSPQAASVNQKIILKNNHTDFLRCRDVLVCLFLMFTWHLQVEVFAKLSLKAISIASICLSFCFHDCQSCSFFGLMVTESPEAANHSPQT